MAILHKIGPYVLIALLAFCAYGTILWNGAGFSHPDDAAASEISCCGFRPVLSMSYWMNRHIGGWMLTNLSLHVMAAFLVYRLAGSTLTAALFAVHPMAADSVASVAGRSALLTALAVFLGVLLVQRWGYWSALYGAWFVVITVGFHPRLFTGIVGGRDHAEFFANYLSALASYVIPRAFVPIGLSGDPDIAASLTALVIALLGAGAAAFIALRYPNWRLGVALLSLPLVPYAFVPLPDVFFEHRAYLALAGAAILMVQTSRRLALVGIGLFLILAIQRADIYATPLKLWTDAAQQAPHKARPHLNAGVALALANRLSGAEAQFHEAVRLDPAMSGAYSNIAVLHLAHGDFSGASAILDQWSSYHAQSETHSISQERNPLHARTQAP